MMTNASNRENNDDNNSKTVNPKIISRETIKPASPTPHHLRNFNLSIIDQLLRDSYSPLIVFFPNNNKAGATENVVKHLKETLSDLLTRFYPFAGEVKDDLHIECNDKGVIFIEAQVNHSLEDFLQQPSDEKMSTLVPVSTKSGEPAVGNYIIGVQVNIFNCGGIGLCTSVTHKIFDGRTYFLFIKEWAAAARGSPKIILPSFLASEIFPNNPFLKISPTHNLSTTQSNCTKRFVFDSKAICLLKAQPVFGSSKGGPTRMEATTALIWKIAAKALSTIRTFGPNSSHSLFSAVNLRKRASPPLPYESVGNLIRVAQGICYPSRRPNLPMLMGEIRESINKINSDHIESLKGKKGHSAFNEIMRMYQDLSDVTEEGDNFITVTSLLNNGIYDLDFGWGKSIWFYIVNPGIDNLVFLNDTKKGDGVEATVTLTSDEMDIFEHDPELLSYATVNPSPLNFLGD